MVTPDQTEALKPMEGQDFVTLLTCTPYQINSHRLLVRGKRIKELPAEVKPETMEEPIPVKKLLFSFVSLVGIAAMAGDTDHKHHVVSFRITCLFDII